MLSLVVKLVNIIESELVSVPGSALGHNIPTCTQKVSQNHNEDTQLGDLKYFDNKDLLQYLVVVFRAIIESIMLLLYKSDEPFPIIFSE